MFSFQFQHIFCLHLADSLIYTCSCTIFLTQSQSNVLWIVCAEELKRVCFYMITFIFKEVTFCDSRIGAKENVE